MSLPTVGPSQLGLSRLSPKARQILKQRAVAEAQRKNAPLVAAAGQGIATANQTFGQQKRADIGATNLMTAYIHSALQHAKSSGLKGMYRQQVLQELNSRAADAASSLPVLISDAAAQRATDIQKAKTDIINAKAGLASDAGSNFSSALSSARTNAASYLNKQKTKGVSSAKTAAAAKRSIHNALLTAVSGYQELGQKGKQPQTDAQWKAFILAVAKQTEGADASAAEAAVRILRHRQYKLVGGFSGP